MKEKRYEGEHKMQPKKGKPWHHHIISLVVYIVARALLIMVVAILLLIAIAYLQEFFFPEVLHNCGGFK